MADQVCRRLRLRALLSEEQSAGLQLRALALAFQRHPAGKCELGEPVLGALCGPLQQCGDLPGLVGPRTRSYGVVAVGQSRGSRPGGAPLAGDEADRHDVAAWADAIAGKPAPTIGAGITQLMVN